MPIKLWNGRKPIIGHLRIVSSKCWYIVPPENPDQNSGQRAREAMMIDYANGSQRYKICDTKDSRVVMLRDGRFSELKIIQHTHTDEDDSLCTLEITDGHTIVNDP